MLGMTEAGSVCLASDDERDQPEHRRGSFGRPVPGLRGEDRRPRDRRTTCATGEVGELWFRGPFLMEGYYGRERHETFTPDGWYRTGDLVPRRRRRLLLLPGRRGDMIKTAGANVSPREVEAAIARRHRAASRTSSASTIADRGQVVAAAVRVPRGQAPPDIDELRAALRDAALGVQGAAALSSRSPTTTSRCCRAASSTRAR